MVVRSPGAPFGGFVAARRRPRWPAAALIGLIVAAAALRFSTLGLQSFWLDETATARLMHLGFGTMLSREVSGESTPPLYYALAWLWTRVFGSGPVGLRSLSALLGTLTVPVAYAAARRMLDRRAGLAAAALVAFSPLLVWYSQEARAYALLVLLCACSLWALADAGEGSRRALALWALACALAIATHYFAVFFVAPQALWLLRRRAPLAAVAAPVVVGLALLPLALHQDGRGNAHFISDSALGTRTLQVPKQLAVGYAAPGETVIVAGAALLVLIAVALAWPSADGRTRRRALRLFALALAAAGVPLLLAAAGFDYLITRNVIAALVPAALALALLASRARAASLALAAFCAVGLAATVGVDANARFQRDNWRDAARAVPARAATAVVVTPGSGRLPLEYYLPRARAFPATGAAVSDICVIGLGVRGTGQGASAPPGAAPPPPPGFAPPVLERHATFVVARYRAAAPVPLPLVLLANLKLARTSATVLLLR